MIIHIVGAGPKTNTIKILHKVQEDSIVVGVDKGASYLNEEGLIPYAIFGDFDSSNDEEIKTLQEKVEHVYIYPPEKDETDLELALQWAVSQKPDKVLIHCATGKRLDHEFGNITLLIRYKDSRVPISIIDDHNLIYVVKDGIHKIHKDNEYKYVSFFSLGNSIEELTLEGFKYPLTNHTLQIDSSLCVSNEIDGEVGSISFSKGIALVIRSKD